MHLECVSVLLFGAGTGQTGVYSLQQWTEEEDGADGGLPHDTVLAFESPSDAEQYAKLLERQMGRRAQVRRTAAAASCVTTVSRLALSRASEEVAGEEVAHTPTAARRLLLHCFTLPETLSRLRSRSPLCTRGRSS